MNISAGIVFQNISSVTNSYSTGSVSGRGSTGGIVGSVGNGSSVTNCFAIGAISSSTGQSDIGGLVGQCHGSVENSAALNPSVISALNVNGGRRVTIRMQLIQPTLDNNVAWSGMTTVNGSTVSSTDGSSENGEDITAAAIRADGTIGGRFTSAGGWTTQDGRLPGLFGETVALPAHLQ